MQLDEMLKMIRQAGEYEIDFLFDEVKNRKRELYPDWQILYYAYTKAEEERMRILVDKLLEYNANTDSR